VQTRPAAPARLHKIGSFERERRRVPHSRTHQRFDSEGAADMSATDKMKNAAQDVEGKAKEAAGRVTGDRSQENEGKGDQVKSDLKNAGENVKDAFKH
jgi:uncharacterized protein YjbJ (UPF0337 family)